MYRRRQTLALAPGHPNVDVGRVGRLLGGHSDDIGNADSVVVGAKQRGSSDCSARCPCGRLRMGRHPLYRPPGESSNKRPKTHISPGNPEAWWMFHSIWFAFSLPADLNPAGTHDRWSVDDPRVDGVVRVPRKTVNDAHEASPGACRQ